MSWFTFDLTPLQIAQRCGIDLLDELASGDMDIASDWFLTHDTSTGTRKKIKPSSVATALKAVTAASALTANRLIAGNDGTRDVKTTSIQISGDDVTIAGNLTVSGTTITFDTETVTVEDPLIKLAKANSADILDIGLYGLYNDGTARYAGLFRDASDGKFRLFKNLTVEPTTTVNIGDASFQLAPLVIGDLTASAMAGSSLVLGTDPTGSELLRVGGAVKISAAAYSGTSLLVDGAPSYFAAKFRIGSDNNLAIRRNADFGAFTGMALDCRNDADSASMDLRFRALSYTFTEGKLVVENSTDATSATDTSASLNTGGGLAVAKKGFFGDAVWCVQAGETDAAIYGFTLRRSATDAILAFRYSSVRSQWEMAATFLSGGGYHPICIRTSDQPRITVGTAGETVFLGNDPESVTASSVAIGGGTIRAAGKVVSSDTTDATDKDTGSIVTEGGIASEKVQFSQTGHNVANKTRIVYVSASGEYGPQKRYTNRTGANSVKGTIVRMSTSYDSAVETAPANSDAPMGIIAEDGIADGSEVWVWAPGAYCQVLLKNSTASTRGYWAQVSDTAGRADITNAAPVPATHPQEIGHCGQSVTAGTDKLALIELHHQ